MKINLAKSAGFCFGVRRAIDIALEAASSDNKVSMLGDIVHNEDVVKKITRAGIKKIKTLKPAKNEVLLIRAHGEPQKIFNRALELGYRLIDATCPMVKEIHKIASGMEKKGCQIIVIGDKEHDEVKGIVGNLKKGALVIHDLNNIPLAKIKKIKKACVVVQSTQNLENVLRILDVLNKNVAQIAFFNTICKPTRTKQDETRRMPQDNDLMIIIGSKNSANTKRLYEIAKYRNKRSFWINSKGEVKKAWFKGAKSVGITAGASTPQEVIQDILQYIRKLTA